MLMHSRYATNPYKLYISLLEKNKQRMIANQQNDVGEFNTILLENLREATLQTHKKTIEDPVGDFFFGEKRVTSRGGSTVSSTSTTGQETFESNEELLGIHLTEDISMIEKHDLSNAIDQYCEWCVFNIEKMKSIYHCVTILGCNYRYNSFY
jgi:uncharacterized UBP type Zn finger protein